MGASRGAKLSDRCRSFRLEGSPTDVFQPLVAAGIPFHGEAELDTRKLRSTHGCVHEGGCTLYAPWRGLDVAGRGRDFGGVGQSAFEIGPALRLHTRWEGRFIRLEVEVLTYAPKRAQRQHLRRWLGGAGLLMAAGFVASGGTLGLAAPVAAVVSGSSAAPFVALVAGQRKQRQQAIKDLLALVEGVYGPLELPAVDGSPER